MCLRGECELLAHYRADVHGPGPLGQGIEIRIVGGLGVIAEYRGVHLDVYFVDHFGETAPAFASDDAVKITPPEVFSIAGGLQLALYRDRTHQVQSQAFEGRILGRKLSHGPDGAS